MSGQWYYARDSRQMGPVSEEELRRLIAGGTVYATDLVWCDTMADWRPAGTIPELFPGGVAPAPPPPVPSVDRTIANTKLAAGISGIAAGMFGVHKFVLGINTPAIIMLAVSLATCGAGAIVMHVIGIVEGIKYLIMSDEEFHQTYMIDKKEWF